MIAYGPGSSPGSTSVSFVIEPAGEHTGGAISVVGDFNDWDRTRDRFTPGADGRWRVNVELHTGRRYAFRYVTEAGHWFDEPDADDRQDNGSGAADCILDLTDPGRPPTDHRPAATAPLDLEAIRARVQAATAGPWQRHGCDVTAGGRPLLRGCDGDPLQRRQADADAEFVAHARADVTALLAALDAAAASGSAAGASSPTDKSPAAESPTTPARFQLRAGLDSVRGLFSRPVQH